MKTAIIGGRNLNNEITLNFLPSLIISGGAKGIDSKAKEYAKLNKIEYLEFKPEYDKYHFKQAPLIRNKQIVDNCDILVAFWDGESKGTKFTIEYAKKQNKEVIINYING